MNPEIRLRIWSDYDTTISLADNISHLEGLLLSENRRIETIFISREAHESFTKDQLPGTVCAYQTVFGSVPMELLEESDLKLAVTHSKIGDFRG